MLIYTSPQLIMVGHIKNILETYGIESRTKEAFQGAGMGEIPAIECWHELLLIDNSQHELAKQIVEEALNSSKKELTEWECTSCKEEIEGQFTECWNCGTSR
jgi:Putative prokaryotic signal transducing protein